MLLFLHCLKDEATFSLKDSARQLLKKMGSHVSGEHNIVLHCVTLSNLCRVTPLERHVGVCYTEKWYACECAVYSCEMCVVYLCCYTRMHAHTYSLHYMHTHAVKVQYLAHYESFENLMKIGLNLWKCHGFKPVNNVMNKTECTVP